MDPIGESARLVGALCLRLRQGNNGHGFGPFLAVRAFPLSELAFRVVTACVKDLSPISR
jgi:hypothetical protein